MSGDGRPGLPRPLLVLLIVLVVAAILVLLFTTVFPWVERNLSDPTLGALPFASG